MTFDELLKQNNLERTGVSYGIQQKMKRYDRFVKEINNAKVKLSNTKKDSVRQEIENTITLGEENASALNNEICAGIENFIKNKDLNERKAANLKLARENKEKNKQNGGQQKPPAQKTDPVLYTVEGVAEKLFKGEKISDKEEVDFYDAKKDQIDALVATLKKEEQGIIEHQPVEKKKASTGKVIAGVIGALVLGGLALFGYSQYNKNKS